MNTKIGTSFGLALLLAVGVIATMLVLGMFGSQKASADVNVTDIKMSSTSAGSNPQLTIEFIHAVTLVAGSGQIIVTFDKNWGIPATIAKSHITLTTHQTSGGTSNPAVDPSIVAGSNSTTVTITIGDTDTSINGNQNMNPQAGGVTSPHILVFSPLAGITNPTSSGVIAGGTDSTAASNWIAVTTTAEATVEGTAIPTTGSYDAAYLSADVEIVRSLSLSPISGPRGTVVTATGKGFSSTGTATVWLDADDDGLINGTEVIQATAVEVSAGAFTATFTADSDFSAGANTVNAIDGGGTADATAATFTVTGNASASLTTAARGGAVKITLAQYSNGTITSITFGGVPADLSSPSTGSTTIASNAGSLTITIPSTTPLGTQVVAVASTGEATRSTTIEITCCAAPVTISPATAVAGQTITASGSGFTASSNIASITVDGTAVAAAGLVSPTTFAGITTDSSGNAVVSFKIPTTILTAGDFDVQLTDAAGRIGEATLTVPARTLTLDPATGKRGSTVTLTGTGYAATNSITISYKLSGATAVAVSASATADSSGSWTGSVVVPSTANIPSTNTITATAATAGGSKTVDHAVPGATITIDPSSAKSGETVTLTGTDFPAFASVAQLDIGSIDARPSPAPSTDGDGNFSTTVLVPGLTAGTQAVIVNIGNISANTSLTVEAASTTTTPTTNATETVFADAIAADALVRVWRFNNAGQSWTFYDPRPAFSAANTLTDASSGDIVWVNVSSQQDFQDQTLFEGWNLISLN